MTGILRRNVFEECMKEFFCNGAKCIEKAV